MPTETAAIISNAILLYLFIGFVFSFIFVALAIQRIDPAANGASWQVRLLLIPGAVLLWPLLAWRWARHPNGIPVERTPHKLRAATAGQRDS